MIYKRISILLALTSCVLAATVTVTSTRDYRIANTQAGIGGAAATGNTVTVTKTEQRGDDTRVTDSNASSGQKTAVTSCHFHGSAQFCIDGNGSEGTIVPAPTNTKSAPSQYTGCHAHEEDTFCLGSEGDEVQFVVEGTSHGSESSSTSSGKGGKNCHFHAGVEHCLEDGEVENGVKSAESCERVDRDYDIPLRIGLLFVILVTSAIGSFGPLFVTRVFNISLEGTVITIIKQFGTGVIISTAFIHLMTHADLMWGNSCISIAYESTATSITMAGLLITFLIEYIGNRVVRSKIEKRSSLINQTNGDDTEAHQSEHKIMDSSEENITSLSSTHSHCHGITPNDKISVMLLEAGIIFHSILIGVTLVVAGDSFFITLFIVILFHQMFEGLALGARIVALTKTKLTTKLLMAAAYSLITPIGMAIGIGTLNHFNGNDPSTIIALGTLDSFSAGVLIWTGLIEMWAHDWLFGYLAHASKLKTAVAFGSLIAGMILMSVLGKWA